MPKTRILSDAIQQMIDAVDLTAKNIAVRISEHMADDMYDEAEKLANQYYSYTRGSYTKYGRTYQLKNIFDVKEKKVAKHGGSYVAGAKLSYFPEDLEYHSNSSKHSGSGSWGSGGDVSSDYVFEELFFAGKHPWYSGSPINDGSYMLISTPAYISPKKAWKRFKSQYDSLYLNNYLEDIIRDEIGRYWNYLA